MAVQQYSLTGCPQDRLSFSPEKPKFGAASGVGAADLKGYSPHINSGNRARRGGALLDCNDDNFSQEAFDVIDLGAAADASGVFMGLGIALGFSSVSVPSGR